MTSQFRSKRCFRCERTLPISEFYAHPSPRDGHLGKCKPCTVNDTRLWRAKHPTVPKPPPTIRERIEKAVIINQDDCWIWQKNTDANGYGRGFYHGGHFKFAHRVSYEEFRGPIPKGLEMDHLCRVPSCVNPYHLEPVTHRVNVLRGISPLAVNAAKTHCIRGHPLSG